MSSATIVIAATGDDVLDRAVSSALSQDHPDTRVWCVIDGPQYVARTLAILGRHPAAQVMALPENTGGNGFYGHRIYAGIGHMVNTDYVLLLDQDNWFDTNHVSSLVSVIESNGWDWAHSLRKIHDRDGSYLCLDDCESLGRWPIFLNDQAHLVDTSSYCIKRETMVAIGHAWHWGWGGDRRFLGAISQHFPKWGTNGLYTMNYRLDGNPNSVNRSFFDQGNAVSYGRYGGSYPWRR